jgi:hypothetical protein
MMHARLPGMSPKMPEILCYAAVQHDARSPGLEEMSKRAAVGKRVRNP